MDFNDAPEEADFRAEARTWLEKTLAAPNAKTLVRIDGPDGLNAAKAYQAKKAAAGYAGLTWKKDVGGRELPPIFSVMENITPPLFGVSVYVLFPIASPQTRRLCTSNSFTLSLKVRLGSSVDFN